MERYVWISVFAVLIGSILSSDQEFYLVVSSSHGNTVTCEADTLIKPLIAYYGHDGTKDPDIPACEDPNALNKFRALCAGEVSCQVPKSEFEKCHANLPKRHITLNVSWTCVSQAETTVTVLADDTTPEDVVTTPIVIIDPTATGDATDEVTTESVTSHGVDFNVTESGPTDDCIGVNCNHGTCKDDFESYVCECNSGWKGTSCDKEDEPVSVATTNVICSTLMGFALVIIKLA